MEHYKTRPGVVLMFICKQPVLIPSRAASQYCRLIHPLSYLWAATWDAIDRGKPLADIIRFHTILTRKPEEEILANLERFCAEMTEKGFMIRVPEDAEADETKDAN